MRIKPFLYMLVGGVAVTLIWISTTVHTQGEAPHLQALIDSSDEAFSNSDPTHTNIIISDKTFIIRAADEYTPSLKNNQGKPFLILERDPEQKSASAFDKMIVENDSI